MARRDADAGLATTRRSMALLLEENIIDGLIEMYVVLWFN